MTKQCKATIQFGDDHGDNHCTFHCQREEGHKGKHQEKSILYDQFPYTLEWMGTIGEGR